jgi:hypothetical protein
VVEDWSAVSAHIKRLGAVVPAVIKVWIAPLGTCTLVMAPGRSAPRRSSVNVEDPALLARRIFHVDDKEVQPPR